MRGWLLDTNVISELVRPRPDTRVLRWVRGLAEDRTYLSVLALAELDQGVEALPPTDGRRDRYQRFRARIEAEFDGRILGLDNEVVRLWGVLSGRHRRETGGRAPVIDTLLVATAQRHRLYLATRNLADVQRLGWPCFDPWTGDPADFPITA